MIKKLLYKLNHLFLKPEYKVGDKFIHSVVNNHWFKLAQFVKYYLFGHFIKIWIDARISRFKLDFLNSWKDRKYRSFWKGLKRRRAIK
jgi:hypothetical protein